MRNHADNVGKADVPEQALELLHHGHMSHVMQVTTMLSHVEEVGKAPLPDQAELDTLRSNVAKQQEKVDQLSTPHSSANGTEVRLSLHCPDTPARHSNMGANVRQYSQTVNTGVSRSLY